MSLFSFFTHSAKNTARQQSTPDPRFYGSDPQFMNHPQGNYPPDSLDGSRPESFLSGQSQGDGYHGQESRQNHPSQTFSPQEYDQPYVDGSQGSQSQQGYVPKSHTTPSPVMGAPHTPTHPHSFAGSPPGRNAPGAQVTHVHASQFSQQQSATTPYGRAPSHDFSPAPHAKSPEMGEGFFRGNAPKDQGTFSSSGSFAQNSTAQSSMDSRFSAYQGASAAPDFRSPSSSEASSHMHTHEQRTFLNAHPANHQQPSNDLRDLRFWGSDTPSSPDTEEHAGIEIEENENQPLKFVFALGVLIIFAAVAWLTFKWSTQTVSHTSPHITADPTPVKVRPDYPGGMHIPHQDKLIYGKLGHEQNLPNQVQGEHILPPPEPLMQPQGTQMSPYQGSQGGYNQAGPYPNAPQNNFQGNLPGNAPSYGPNPPQNYGPVQNYSYGPPPPHGQGPQMQSYPAQQHQPSQTPMYPRQQGDYAAGPVYPQNQVQQNQVQQQGQQQGQQGTQGLHYPDEDGERMEEGEAQYYPQNIKEQKAKKPEKQNDIDAIIDTVTQATPVKKGEKNHPLAPQTGYFPGGIPAQGTPQNMDAHAQNRNIRPTFFKARVASLPTKQAAEQEWDRLKKLHKDLFKTLNKAIQEQTAGGKKYHVLYILGLQNEEKAKDLCKKIGKNCTYTKQ